MDFDAICRRAGGRRRYNAQRRRAADARRRELARLVMDGADVADAARALGVHRVTAWRDVQRIAGTFGSMWRLGAISRSGRVWRWMQQRAA